MKQPSLSAHPIALGLFLITAVAIFLVGMCAPLAAIVVLEQGSIAVLVLAAAIGLGAWPVVWLGLGSRAVTQQVCLAAGLGFGLLGTATLGLGIAGWLGFGSTVGLLAVGGIAGLVRVKLPPRPTGGDGNSLRLAGLLLLSPLAAALACALFAAALPPRILWMDEAFGYDVLEYHLQVPREYYEAGRIHFLSHNVYASFPQQMESLYLLLMYILGGAREAAIPAQFMHLTTGIVAVLAVGAWSAPGLARTLTFLVLGTVPWLSYLGALAYVELGVLLFSALCTGLLLDCLRASAFDWRWMLAAGLLAGFAGGCKYTALVLIVMVAGGAWLIAALQQGAMWRGVTGWPIVRGMVGFGIGAGVAFSPWLARNAVFTGNPVYPFAYRIFAGAAWSAAQDEQWQRGHTLQGGAVEGHSRLRTLVDEVLTSRRFGPVLFIMAGLGAVLGLVSRDPSSRSAALFLSVWVIGLLGAWMFLTHMPGRFAVPLLVPGGYLVSLAGAEAAVRNRILSWVLIAFAVSGALLNLQYTATLLGDHQRYWQRFGVDLRALPGATEGIREAEPLNQLALPPGARVKLIGEARVFYVTHDIEYTVVFNRDPWLEFATTASPAEAVGWLRTHGVTHVVFSWPEIDRLRRSYGFPALVTREWTHELERAGLRPVAPPGEVADGGLAVFAVPAEAPASAAVGVDRQ